MRDIKFRFFCNGKMYYPTLIGLMAEYDRNPAVYQTVDGIVPHYNDGNLMQFTGLYDKGGEEIYEGDIVAFMDGHDGYLNSEQHCIGLVNWEFETASFQLTGRIEAESHECLEECEIIGNIYENPELLEQTP